METVGDDVNIPRVGKHTSAESEGFSNLGITVESASDSECEESDGGSLRPLPDRTLSRLASEISNQNNSPVFGSVSVTNSSEVHFGSKTVINGPVTIRQVIGSSLAFENNGYVRTGDESAPHPAGKSASAYRKDEHIPRRSKWKIRPQSLVLGLFGVAVTASLITLISIFLLRNGDEGLTAASLPDIDPNAELLPNNRLRYVSRTDWIAQPVEDQLDSLKHPAPWVIIAHTATEDCTSQSKCVLVVRTIQTFHIESRNWSDIAYNFLIGGDGSAYVGRGWDYVGAHTKYYNSRSIGIAFIGTFNNIDPPRRQVIACQQLIEDGIALGKISKDYKLFGHRQLYSTLSPGDRVFSIIQKWPHWSDNNTDSVN